MFRLIPFSKLRDKLAKLSNSVSENRNHIRLFAESIAYCVVTGSLGWLAYEFHETVLTIERCVQKDPMLLNYKAPEYIFVDQATFTGKLYVLNTIYVVLLWTIVDAIYHQMVFVCKYYFTSIFMISIKNRT